MLAAAKPPSFPAHGSASAWLADAFGNNGVSDYTSCVEQSKLTARARGAPSPEGIIICNDKDGSQTWSRITEAEKSDAENEDGTNIGKEHGCRRGRVRGRGRGRSTALRAGESDAGSEGSAPSKPKKRQGKLRSLKDVMQEGAYGEVTVGSSGAAAAVPDGVWTAVMDCGLAEVDVCVGRCYLDINLCKNFLLFCRSVFNTRNTPQSSLT